MEIKKALDEIKNGDAPTIRAEARRLKYVAPLVNPEVLAKRYGLQSNNNDETEALTEAYKNLTGEDIKEKARLLND